MRLQRWIIRFHLDRQVEQLTAQGMPPDDALRMAIRKFSAVEPRKEECRDARRVDFCREPRTRRSVRLARRGE